MSRTLQIAMVLGAHVTFWALLIALTGCGGGGQSSSTQNTGDQQQPTEHTEPLGEETLPPASNDQDGDGIADSVDAWPSDASRPVVTQLWGRYGESWDTDEATPGIQSRLPFFAFAGYRDGNQLPRPGCTLLIADFGAVPDDQQDDTDAFWQALAQARLTSSVTSPEVICLDSGVYNLSRQLHLSQSGMVLRGAGRSSTTLKFAQGMIAQTYPEFIGNVSSNWDGNKAIILGDDGMVWRDMVMLNELGDLSLLPKVGDLEIHLPAPLSANQQILLQESGNRIRLKQASHYSNREIELHTPVYTAGLFGGPKVSKRVSDAVANKTFQHQYNEFSPMKFLSGYDTYVQGNYTEYKYAHGQEVAYQQLVVSYEPGSTVLRLDRPVRFDMTAEHEKKRPKLQVMRSEVEADIEIGIEDLTVEFPATPWKDCSGALPGYPCTDGLAAHSGYWAQGGIEIKSDFSWARNIRFQNAGNPIKINGDFNTVQGLILDSNRPTSEGVGKSSSPTDPNRYLKTSVVGHVGVKTSGTDNLVQDVVIRANFHHTLSMANAHGNVLSDIRAEQPLAHPTDSDGREYVKINLDHHRQIIYANLWTQIDLGGSYRMWDSTGNITEGFNVAAYNTYWGLDSSTPSIDYWPHNRNGSVEWGYHYINIVGSNITDKPAVPQQVSIAEMPYPYANRNPELNPFPYHPENAHLEVIDPAEIWPRNLYQAQRSAYDECRLPFKPLQCE